jgi:hypothetical protein
MALAGAFRLVLLGEFVCSPVEHVTLLMKPEMSGFLIADWAQGCNQEVQGHGIEVMISI